MCLKSTFCHRMYSFKVILEKLLCAEFAVFFVSNSVSTIQPNSFLLLFTFNVSFKTILQICIRPMLC